eukprot:contig_4663_g1005
MSVPVILGNSFGDTEVKTISTEDQTVTLKTGTVIPILREKPEENPASARWTPVCACLPRQSGKLYLNTKAKLKPGTVSEGAHYIVEVDASYDQLGCALAQQHPDGEYLPVGYFSWGLSPAEKNYCATDIEAVGVVWAVTHLRSFLEGTEFLVRCDHSALTSVMTSNSPNRRLTAWRLRLSEFTYQIRHKPGKDHKVADALSRLPTKGLDTTPLYDQIPVLAVTTRSAQAPTERKPKGLGQITLKELIDAQAVDDFCKKHLSEERLTAPEDAKWQRSAFYFLNEDGSVAMDLLGPLPTSENGYTTILVICDRFTKLVRAMTLKGTTALEVASAFIKHWVAAYGIPDSTLTDNGPQFAAVYFQGGTGLLGIATNYTSPYHPQTNGQVERYNKIVMRQLRTFFV